ncbi:hypothetical protein V2S84_01200 [Azotobacter chroococcum]|nr:hypothetical protein [Azotobacter chroococcum]
MSETVKRYWLESYVDGFYKARQFVLAADHDRIVSALSEAGVRMQAEQDKNGLLPCPFCGGPAQQVFQLVGCLKCETAVKSVEHWNRRIGGVS